MRRCETILTSSIGLSGLAETQARASDGEKDMRKNSGNPNKETSRAAENSEYVLVVDDNPVVQEVVALILGQLGYGVEVATNGVEAVGAISQSRRYVAVFMECEMPEMDGYAAAQAIRQQEANSHVPIIALTSNASAGNRIRCLACGMDDYLRKPPTTEKIASVLRRHLGRCAPHQR